TGAAVEDGNVAVERRDEIPRGVLCALDLVGVRAVEAIEAAELALQRVAPRREIVPARAARGLRVRRDDLDPGCDEIVPVPNAFRVPLPPEVYYRGRIGRPLVRQPHLPARLKAPAVLVDRVDVVREGEGDDVRVEAVDDGPRLAAGARVRLLHDDLLPGL